MTVSESNDRPVVLGRELASARAAEERRLAGVPTGKSPLPDAKYDRWRGDFALLNPTAVPLDERLRATCQWFAKKSASEREAIRRSISMDEFYTLLAFGRRCAVFSRRARDLTMATDGLTAVCMIELERIDPRDALWCLGLLHHAISKNSGDAGAAFRAAADVAERPVADLIVSFVQRAPEDRDLTAWGYDEFESAGGIGFIGRGYAPYAPDHDLKRIAVEIAKLIERDKYLVNTVEYASGLPSVWLGPDDDAALSAALDSVKGAVTISAALLPGEHPDHSSQQFTVFLAEVGEDRHGTTLLQLSRGEGRLGHGMLGLLADRVFCLVVARSFVEGCEAFESTESLQRFSAGIQHALDRAVR